MKAEIQTKRKTVKTHTLKLEGNNYTIGQTIGRFILSNPILMKSYTTNFLRFDKTQLKHANELFQRWCPGLKEELEGFSDALHVSLEQIIYYTMTYLHPNCSHIALLPQITQSGHPLLARNYEFNDELEDFTLIKTSVTGKYTHIGTSVLSFGRDDGFNEHGLAVTMSSCGFPVGAGKGMRLPALCGLQFWAVIRTLLENCKTVEESLLYLKEMPIAYNLNLILLDKTGHAALLETLDGKQAVKQIKTGDNKFYLHATNHAHIDEIKAYEPKAMNHSLVRYRTIKENINYKKVITIEELKKLLLNEYPTGLCCHFYKDFFGTTKSMIIDPLDGTIELCWGGRIENGWKRYSIFEPFYSKEEEIEIVIKTAPKELFNFEL